MTRAWPRQAVVLVAKAPEPGRVKTRLCPPLQPCEATAVAAALLADAEASAGASGADVWCAFAGDEAALDGLLHPSTRRLRQRGDGLAERLAAAQADLFTAGYQRVVLYGADCPTVCGAYLRRSLSALDRADVALGPATDGGYTVLAAAAPTPRLFAGVAMGTDRVLGQTLRRAADAGLRVRLLEPRHDLDTAADLLAALRRGQLAGAPRTATLVRRLVDRLGPVA